MHIFLDTMMYLHWADIDTIDFLDAFGVSSATIVVPRITTRELDSHKNDHSSKRIRNKARSALNKIEACVIDNVPVRPNVQVCLETSLPDLDFDANGLNPNWNDDILIVSVLAFHRDNPELDVVLVSNDTTARLKCRELGVNTVTLPEKYQLPEQLDAHEDEIRKLKRQIQRLENAMPKLAVYFAGTESNTAKFGLPNPLPTDEPVVNQSVEEARKYIEEYAAEANVDQLELAKNIALTLVPDSEINRFKTGCEKYPEEIQQFELAKIEFENRTRRAFRFAIEIRNFGTAPATDVDIHMHFPDGFELYEEDDLPEPPRKPGIPRKPRTQFEMSVGNIRALPNIANQMNLDHIHNQFSTFKLKKSNSYDLSDHFQTVKHGDCAELPELFLIFDSFDVTKSFNCTYELRVGNLPDKIAGELHFVVETGVENGE